MNKEFSRSLAGLVLASALPLVVGCSTTGGSGFDDRGPDAAKDGGEADGPRDAGTDMRIVLTDGNAMETAPCVGLECQQTCASTAISGKVYDPAGVIPLYNVYVYVPNAPLDPIADGPVCKACQAPASGNPIASDTTKADGTFKITNAPSGTNIPVILQLGKWRRHLTVSKVVSCADNSQPDGSLRLPRKQHETSPDDNIPLIAFTTGCDGAECFLKDRIGIDASEFTNDTGTGRVHVYSSVNDDGQGFPGGNGSAIALWSTPGEMMKYDIVFDACECGPFDRGGAGSTNVGYANFSDYLDMGGRAFTTHYFYNFFADSSQFGDLTCQGQGMLPTIGQWNMNKGLPFASANCPNDSTIPASTGGPGSCMTIDTAIPKGVSFADWYAANNSKLTFGGGEAHGYIGVSDLRADIGELDPALLAAGTATPWLYAGDLTTGYDTYYLSVNTPVGIDSTTQCGRAVFSDVHVSGNGGNGSTGETVPGGNFPTYCATDPNMSNHGSDELALEFLFFDLSSCVQDDTKPPPPPPPK